MSIRLSALFLLGFSLSGCAGGVRTAPVTPAELQSLDQDASTFARDGDALTRVGIRFYDAGSYERARDVLTAALGLRPSFTTAVYLGLSFEGLQSFDDAETSYRMAGTLGLSEGQRKELDRRIASLSRTRLDLEARQAVARETELARTPPVPNSVAVLPWSYVGGNRRQQGLGAGVAHLVMTDLGKVSAIGLVERARVQALLDEMALGDAGHVEPVSAARSGLLLRANYVVAGVVRETSNGVRLEASIYRTTDGSLVANAGADDRVEALFEMEKSVVLSLIDQLGVTVTPGERRTLTERSTADLQAFLAFSDGLAAHDRGDFRSAGGLFALAAGRDPAFGAARQFGAANGILLAGAGSSVAALERLANPASPAASGIRGTSLLMAVQVISPSTGAEVDLRARNPAGNPRLAEALRQDNPSRIAIIGDIIIIIPRP